MKSYGGRKEPLSRDQREMVNQKRLIVWWGFESLILSSLHNKWCEGTSQPFSKNRNRDVRRLLTRPDSPSRTGTSVPTPNIRRTRPVIVVLVGSAVPESRSRSTWSDSKEGSTRVPKFTSFSSVLGYRLWKVHRYSENSRDNRFHLVSSSGLSSHFRKHNSTNVCQMV